jgi:hypothetical protein
MLTNINLFFKRHYVLIMIVLLIIFLVSWLFVPSPYYNMEFYKPKKRILLISSNIKQFTYEKDIEKYLVNVDDIKYMYYDYDNISGYMDLVEEIEDIMKDYPDEYESVGIMYHNNTPNTLQLFKKDTNVIDTKSQSIEARDRYDEFKLFARCINEMGHVTGKGHVITDIDIITCRLLPESDKDMFKYIHQQTGISVNASTDPTGNGSDWFLEQGNRDLVGTYFNEHVYDSAIKLIA